MRRATLENGLRVVAVEMPHVSYVSLRLVVGAGSRDDPREKAGISHFVEHVIFRGTERHPHEAALRAHLASLGIRMNAFTSKETTSLDLEAPRENVLGALQVLSEVLTTPTFNGFEIERRIVMEEMNHAYDENDGTLWPLEMYADGRLWPYHGLGLPCIGEPHTVLNITLDDVKQYLGTHYRAGGMALGIAGGFELDGVMPDVRRLFGILPPGEPARIRRAPPAMNGALHWQDLPYSPRARVRMMFPFEVKSARDNVIAHMLQAHLCTPGAGRIHDALRSRTGVAYTGDSEIEVYSDCARFTIFAEVKKEKMPQMVGAVARTLQDLRFRGLGEAEHDAGRLLLTRDVRAAHDVPELAANEYTCDRSRAAEPGRDARAASHDHESGGPRVRARRVPHEERAHRRRWSARRRRPAHGVAALRERARRVTSSGAFVRADELTPRDDVSAHRVDHGGASGAFVEAEHDVQREHLEVVAVHPVSGRRRSRREADLHHAVLALATGNAVTEVDRAHRHRIDVEDQPVHEGAREGRVGIFDHDRDRTRRRRHTDPFEVRRRTVAVCGRRERQ